MAQMRIFVSHSNQDNEFCVSLVKALRDAGADVWFDEHHLGPGELTEKIIEVLNKRPVFIVVLSKAALASSWVRDETLWAYTLNKRYRDRIILPVTVEPLEPKQFDTWLFLENFKRVEAPNLRPFTSTNCSRANATSLSPDTRRAPYLSEKSHSWRGR